MEAVDTAVVATVAEVLEAEDSVTVVSDQLMLKPMHGMDMVVMEDMGDTDTLDTLERDQLMPTVVDSVDVVLEDVVTEDEEDMEEEDIVARDLLMLVIAADGNWRLW